MISDAERLGRYVAAWDAAVHDAVTLLRELSPDDWDRPTDLAGWDVRAVAAHLAHLESVLAGDPQPEAEVEVEQGATLVASYTAQGPAARRGWTPERILDELETSAAVRRDRLRADPPTDPQGAPDITPAGIAWDWQTLLSNRVVDVWMHDQDVRRAVGRPGGLDTPAAAHTLGVFARALGYVVGKRVGAPPGSSVALTVTGTHGFSRTVEVGADGRAAVAETDDPTVRLTMGTEEYVVLSGGRRDPADVDVEFAGDAELGARVLAALAVTP